VCPKMCVESELRMCNMQPYRACSPPPPPCLRFCLLCDADPDRDPDLAHYRLFFFFFSFSFVSVCESDSFVLLRLLILRS
jgi:hypothetical protein